MNLTLPSGRAGQISSVLLALLVAIAGWNLLVVPFIDFYDVRRQDLEHRAMQVEHMAALADALPRLKASLDTGDPLPVMTLTGNTDSVAAASLQGTVQDMVRNVGANLGSVEIMPGETVEGLRRVGLKVALSGDLETITRLLSAMEMGEPAILVDELQIHGNAGQTGNTPQATPPDSRLDVSFTVYGFRADQAEDRRP
jgi:hypothetical protein